MPEPERVAGPSDPVKDVIARIRGEDPALLDELLPQVYEELRAVARRLRRRTGNGNSLNTTALVHELYLKLRASSRVGVTNRAHFLRLAARAMRQVLSNHARADRAAKRGGGQSTLTLSSSAPPPDDHVDDAGTLIALDTALTTLGQRSERQARVVECRFYAGMSIEETAEALEISEATVKRDWAVAQAWLYRELLRD